MTRLPFFFFPFGATLNFPGVIALFFFFICLALYLWLKLLPISSSSFSWSQTYQEICHRFWSCVSFPGGISPRAFCPSASDWADCAPCLLPRCGPEISLYRFPWNSLHLYSVLDTVLLGVQSSLLVYFFVSVEVNLRENFALSETKMIILAWEAKCAFWQLNDCVKAVFCRHCLGVVENEGSWRLFPGFSTHFPPTQLPTGKLGRRLSVIEMRDACLARRVKPRERSWVPYKNKELFIGELRGAASWLKGIWNPRKEWLWAHSGAELLRVLRGPVRFSSRKWPLLP